MVTTLLLTVHTLRNIHSNARENIIRTREKRKASYFFVAHSVYIYIFTEWAWPTLYVCVYICIYIYIYIYRMGHEKVARVRSIA